MYTILRACRCGQYKTSGGKSVVFLYMQYGPLKVGRITILLVLAGGFAMNVVLIILGGFLGFVAAERSHGGPSGSNTDKRVYIQ